MTPAEAARILARHLAALPVETATLEAVRQGADAADTAQALARIAADPECCDHAPLVALLLSPGPASRLELEPLLQALALDAAGTERLARDTAVRVGSPVGRVGLLPPDGRRLELDAPDWAVEGFVRRLRPEATAPAELLAILRRRLGDGPEALEAAARLRHGRLAWSPARLFLAAALLERARPDELAELLAWTLAFLDLAGEDFEPRAALAQRRRELEAQLRLAGFAEESQAKGSFELRLAQGQRLGHVHGPEVREALARLDRVARLCLGLRADSLDGVAVRDLGAVTDPELLDPETLTRLLG